MVFSRLALLTGSLLLSVGSFAWGRQPAEQPTAESPPASALSSAPPPGEVVVSSAAGAEAESLGQLAGVPATEEELAARLALTQQQLDALRPTTQPSSDTTDERQLAIRAIKEGLYQDWDAYRSQLERLRQLRGSIAKLTSELYIKSIAEQQTIVRQETQAIEKLPEPLMAAEGEVAETQKQVQTVEIQVKALADAQGRRATQLAEGFQKTRTRLEAELKQLQLQRQELSHRLDDKGPTTTAPADNERTVLEEGRLEVQTASHELSLQVLALEQQRAELQSKQDEQMLTALREKLDAMSRRLAALKEARSRSTLQILELRRQRATDPGEIALLDMELFRERLMLAYFQNRDRLALLRARFPNSDLERVRERVALSKAYWQRALDSMEYRSGDEALDLHGQVREEAKDFNRRLVQRRQELGRTLREMHDLRTVRDRAMRRINEMADAVSAALQSKDAAEQTRLQTEATTIRADLLETMRKAIQEVEEVVGRLDEAVKILESRVERLAETEQELHWSRITRMDSGLTGADWAGAGSELRAMFASQPSSAADAPQASIATNAVEEQLFAGTRGQSEKMMPVLVALRDDVSSASLFDWIKAAVGMAAAVVLGIAITRLARRRGVRLARLISQDAQPDVKEKKPIESGLSARLDLLWWNMVGDLAIVLLVAAVAALAGGSIAEQPVSRQVAGILLAYVVGAVVLLRLIHHLFEADSPPHRPIPCSNPVARHYRWWLSVLILFSLVVLAMPSLLSAMNVAPTLQSVMIEIYKGGFLLLLLFFLLPKGRVLGSGGRKRHWSFVAASVAYPLEVAAVAALLVLQIVGYGALVSYVGQGLLLSLLVLLAAGTISGYAADALDRFGRMGTDRGGRGAIGATRAADTTGLAGAMGTTGPTGATGETCATGTAGSTDATDAAGATGSTGARRTTGDEIGPTTRDNADRGPAGGEAGLDAARRKATGGLPGNAEPPSETALPHAEAAIAESRAHYVIELARWCVRLGALVGAFVLILYVWNVSLKPSWLNWRMLGLGGLVILIALIFDRIVYSAMFTLHRSGRLPESTVNIIRRWIRGVLLIVVAFALIAVAGLPIDNIWTFLTTLLAMVAIGFVAVWSMLSNILATLVILIWRPFNVGERIELLPEQLQGQVVDINFMYTILKGDDGSRVSVPNNLFTQKFIRRSVVRGQPERTLAEQLEADKPLE